MRAYLDSCAIIYAVEGNPAFRGAVIQHLAPVQIDPLGILITSRLSRLECRIKPLRDGDSATLARYDGFFSRSRLQLLEISSAVVEKATELRVKYRFKTPDALHLATAIESHADFFLTGDDDLRRCLWTSCPTPESSPTRKT